MTFSVCLDSNVIVGYLDHEDSLHQRAKALLENLEHDHVLVLLDFVVAEALSTLCRRAFERCRQPPDLGAILERVRTWHRRGRIVVLQRAGTIGEVASFDPDFDKIDGFKRIS